MYQVVVDHTPEAQDSLESLSFTISPVVSLVKAAARFSRSSKPPRPPPKLKETRIEASSSKAPTPVQWPPKSRPRKQQGFSKRLFPKTGEQGNSRESVKTRAPSFDSSSPDSPKSSTSAVSSTLNRNLVLAIAVRIGSISAALPILEKSLNMAVPETSKFHSRSNKHMAQVTEILDNVTTQAAALPDKSNLAFHRSLNRQLANDLDHASSRILALTERLLAVVQEGKNADKAALKDLDDVLDGYRRGVVSNVDRLLEHAVSVNRTVIRASYSLQDSQLDKINGSKKEAAIAIKPSALADAGKKLPGPFSASTSSSGSRLEFPGMNAPSRIPKPQLKFPDAVDNSLTKWAPTLPYKHHAMVPLGYQNILDYAIDPDSSRAHRQLKREKKLRTHPYYYETRNIQYPVSLFTGAPPIKPAPMEDSEVVWVDTPEALADMVEELKMAKEIAMDLEHHSQHSYHGFTCLIQISTRERDWLVDAIALRGALREDKLGGVLADPNILKILHGADMDIVWLQKDFDIYVVNMFDTFQATKVLGLQEGSLRYLLDRYCQFPADKKYQMADWRVRPLTTEMAKYARADTHFLLYIFDNLRNDLLDKSRAPSPSLGGKTTAPGPESNPQRAMRQVLEASAEVTLKLFDRSSTDPQRGIEASGSFRPASNHLSLTERLGMIGHVWKKLYMWRDAKARELDESTQYVLDRKRLLTPSLVLPNHLLRPLSLPGMDSLAKIKSHVLSRSVFGGKYPQEIYQTIIAARKEFKPSGISSAGSFTTKSTPVTQSRATSADSSPEPDVATESAAISDASAKQGGQDVQEALQDVWGDVTRQDVVVRSSASALFKGTDVSEPRVDEAASSRSMASSLFGTRSSKEPGRKASPTFLGIVESITASFFPTTSSTAQTSEVESTTAKAQLPEPETVPFVPSAQRTTSATDPKPETQSKKFESPAKRPAKVLDDDSEVVSVKKKRQERKPGRGKSPTPSSTSPSESGSTAPSDKESALAKRAAEKAKKKPKRSKKLDDKAKKKAEKAAKRESERIPEFDYSKVTNLLDDPSSAPGSTPRSKKANKQKSGKSVVVTGSTFGKVPQDASQPKAGNRSQTFH